MTTDYVPGLCFTYNNMDKVIKEKIIAAQGVSEAPDPVGVSSGVPDSARRSSGD